MSSNDPYAAVTPAPSLEVRAVPGLNPHFRTLARGNLTAWVDAED
jgi:hypothetical protein